jgi:hypothetical protein
VKKIGYYAIALYSGQLAPPRLRSRTGSRSRRRSTSRCAFWWPDNSGKSSLVNALFGESRANRRAAVTAGLTPYRLQHDDMGDVLISTARLRRCKPLVPEDAQLTGDFDLVLLVQLGKGRARCYARF